MDDAPAAAPGSRTARNDGRSALIRLAVVVLGGIVLTIVFDAWAVLVVVLALVLMVMLHEFGHFATAKWSGMKVTEYFLGFGPRLWSIRRGETEYGVKAIPAGGYVRIVGMTMLEEVDPADEARSYRQASFPRRIAVAVAGSTMHFIMAFFLLFALFAISGAPVTTAPTITALGRFTKGLSPAERAGLKPGDTIVAIDGHEHPSENLLISVVNKHPGDLLTMVVSRDGHDLTLHVRPVDGRHVVEVIDGVREQAAPSSGPATGIIGVELTDVRNQTVGPFTAVGRAGSGLGTLTAETFSSLGKLFSLHGLGNFAHQVASAGNSSTSGASSASSSNSPQLLSILGVVQIGAEVVRQDLPLLLELLAAINLFVGIVNLFPMLPLDGGHVAIAVYERVRSRKGRPYHADVAKLMPVAYLFLLFIVVLGLGALYMNIVHPAQLPGG